MADEITDAAQLAYAERWVRRRASTTNGTVEGKRSLTRLLREYDWRAEAINAMAAEMERLEAQRAAVLALHYLSPNAPEYAPYCWECGSSEEWPCSTARALGVE